MLRTLWFNLERALEFIGFVLQHWDAPTTHGGLKVGGVAVPQGLSYQSQPNSSPFNSHLQAVCPILLSVTSV